MGFDRNNHRDNVDIYGGETIERNTVLGNKLFSGSKGRTNFAMGRREVEDKKEEMMK